MASNKGRKFNDDIDAWMNHQIAHQTHIGDAALSIILYLDGHQASAVQIKNAMDRFSDLAREAGHFLGDPKRGNFALCNFIHLAAKSYLLRAIPDTSSPEMSASVMPGFGESAASYDESGVPF